ncbi:protein argonaute 4A-like [Macadamia integrifolia]|uniref:protein argonaute 4A-like n=1 Tax=Macadamia integrifolia TaxID=60698 RepID=UPI001C4F86B4|nr:protein argonaute 4A-like [Macadamia integrifolia]XP_042514454.1 protein argonaute 4A-like [Macadamia integrifolia]XP_042514455.1 protein argonaute 4A-like [Macadamia integrifolia]
MDPSDAEGTGPPEALPPPPPIPPNIVPQKLDTEVKSEAVTKASKPKRVPMARTGIGRKGQSIQLLTNHFKVNVSNVNGFFFHYSVSVLYEDGRPAEGKGTGRRVMDRVHDTYESELAGKEFAYDGEKSLFTVGALPANKLEFTVVLQDMPSNRASGNESPGGNGSPNETDRKRLRRPYQSKTFKVEISFAAKIPMQSIANALRGQESENSQEALRVLDIILRQHAAKQGCLLVRQSFFHNDPKNFTDLGGGVLGCRGFHSSFRATQGGLSLNIDVSTTMIIQPGPVMDFLIANQKVRNPGEVDWAKAKRTLKNLRVKISPSNTEYKITGLSELPCNQQLFTLKLKGGRDENGDGNGSPQTIELTVYEYFKEYRHIELRYSDRLPCINVGKPKRPTYFPIELCSLVSLQRYTKALSTFQRSSLVEKSRQKPQERMRVLTDALKSNNYDSDSMLRACGVSINTNFTQVEGRVLPAPRLKVGSGEDFQPRNGRWNFNNKKLVEPSTIQRWAVVNFSARCDVRGLVRDMIKCGEQKGIHIEAPFNVFEESPQSRRGSPISRVEQMFDQIKSELPGLPQFLLCLLPERKNSDVYGPWKRKNLADFGIVTQCIAPTRVNDQYLTNVLLKINAKLGGMNSLLSVERSPSMPMISKAPTIILGMDVSHGSPGQSDVPSIAAVVSSRQWPLISRYRASVRTQSPKVEMIDNLFKRVSDTEDEGIIRELLLDFYGSSQKRKPDQIIIFRDGVSESQFNQVLNIELDQIIEACKFLDESWSPKFVVIVAQKNHHTKFFQPGSPDNVPPGTVIDNKVGHPRNNDFYMCSHAGMIGTTRPTHYHVLYDEIGYSPDDMQELVHSLSYVYQRSTTAVSVVAPICYAHLAATQVSQFIKFDDMSETSSGHGGVTSAGAVPVPELPRLHQNVSSSMFFC